MTGYLNVAGVAGGKMFETTCWAEPTKAWPGLTVAATEVGGHISRVHLIGELTQQTAQLLTDGLTRVARAHPGPDRTVLLDLSALTIVDDAGLTALAASQDDLRGRGYAVHGVWPHGPMLRLLDQAARAGWCPPELRCTDILRWRRKANRTARRPSRSPNPR